MDTQINNISHVNLSNDSSVINNSGTNIKNQIIILIFKLSPLFVKLFDDLYDVRYNIIKFCTFLFLFLSSLGLTISLYIFSKNQSDISFDLVSSFFRSIIVLVLYYFFNKIFYNEFSQFGKAEKIIFLFLIDFIVWGFLIF